MSDKYSIFVKILQENSSKQSQIKIGIKVEEEHKDVYELFKKEFEKIGKTIPLTETELYQMIAEAHLREISDYYTRLKKMENEAKK